MKPKPIMKRFITSYLTAIILFTTLFAVKTNQLQAQIKLDSGLIAYFPLDGNNLEKSGNNVATTGNATGIFPSTNYLGQANSAQNFNGTYETGMISLPVGFLDTLSNVTMAGWICPSNFVAGGYSLFGANTALEVTVFSGPNSLRVYHPTSGTITVNLTGANNTWYHVAVTASTTGLKVYVNGIEVATRTGNYKLLATTNTTNIGGKVKNQTGTYLNGRLDDIRFYKRVLTTDEIKFLAGNASLTYDINTLSSTTVCTGSSFSVPFTILGTGIADTNSFKLQLSDASGNFSDPLEIGSTTGNSDGSIIAFIPNNMPSGTGYKLRIISILPYYIGTVSTQSLTINNASEGSSTLSRGKILEYLFDTNTNDNTGFGHNGTVNGGVSYVDDRHGNSLKAVQLNGSTGYIQIPSGNWFNDNIFTASVWVNPSSYNNWCRIFDFGNGQDSDNLVWALSEATTGKQYFNIRNNATVIGTVAGTQINLNKWSHVAITCDGDNLLMYLNGNIIAAGTTTAFKTITRTLNYIGKSNWTTNAYANAAFDNFTIWNRSLTPYEIHTLAADGSIVTNSPVCSGNALYLAASQITGATYSWSGPNGFTSSTRENHIANATSAMVGKYKVTITINGCSYVDSTSNISVITPASQATASFTGLPIDTYLGANVITLTGTPTGGYYSGNGIANNLFTASNAGLGSHPITYNYYNTTAGCYSNNTLTVNVQASSTLDLGETIVCSGNFYDAGGTGAQYGNNETITKTFTSANGQMLQFAFGTSGIATGDTLFAYDGNSTNAPLLVAYTYSSRFEGFTSTGSSVTFKFVSGASGTATGWNASYICTTTPQGILNYSIGGGIVATCSGNFYDDGGSGGDHGDTGSNTQTFYSRNGERLKFTFTSFNTDGGSDKLYIYDGPNNTYPQITMKAGYAGGFTVESTGDAITFYFTKFNNTLTSAGWAASFTCTTPALTTYNLQDTVITACSGAFYDDGGANTNYSDNSEKVMTIKSGNSQYLQFDFSNVNISTSDSLFIYDGPSVNAKLYAIYTGVDIIDDFTTLDSTVTFRFKTNSTTNASGWKSTFVCTSTPGAKIFTHSGGVIYTCTGKFYDEGGTGNFGDAGTFTQTYKSYNGNRLKFDFTSFVTGSSDILRVYDGPNNTYPVIATKSGTLGAFSVESSSDALTFIFTEFTNSATAAGWIADISCTTPILEKYIIKDTSITICAGVLYDDGGATANYGDNVDKTITFKSPTNEFFFVDFMNSSISASDSLFVFDGDDVNAPGIGIYTASSRYESFTTTGSSITFRLKTNATTNASGFQINFSCTSIPQAQQSFLIGAGVIYTCDAKFYDDGGASGDHGDNGSFTQTFKSKNGNRLTFNFTSFTTAGGSDILRIYDGPNTSYPQITSKSGYVGAFNVESTGDAITVTFTEFNNTLTAAGWAADISCTTPVLDIIKMSTDSIKVCDAMITDKGGRASNYSDNLNDTLILCSANEQQLKIVFNYAETAFGAGDSLWIFDGSNVASPKLGTYFASSRIDQIVSSSTCLTMVFHSNATTTAEGFEGIISCINTPPSTMTYQLSSGERNICTGALYDNGGTSNYTTGTWTQTYTSYNNERIRAAKVSFDVGTNHNLKVYDGPNASATLIGTYNNTTPAPAAFQSTGSNLTFVFNSSNTASANRAGFQFNMSCFSINPMDISWLSSPVCAGSTLAIPFTLNDTCYTGNQFKAELSNKNGSFISPVLIGTLTDSISGTITATIPSNSPNGNAYRIRIYSTNPVMMSAVSPNPIVIYALPAIPAVSSSGSLTICKSTGSVALSIPVQTGVNYRWIKDGTTTVGGNQNTYTATEAGTYTAEVSGTCDTILSSNSKTVIAVDPALNPSISTSGSTDLCSGSTVILSIPKNNTGTYQWYKDAGTTGTNDTILTVGTAGKYTVKLTNVCGDVWAIDTTTITIKGTAPTVAAITNASALTFCNGDSVKLSIPQQTGVTYNWLLNDTTPLNINAEKIIAKQAGVYKIDVSNICGTKTSSNTKTVIVNYLPNATTVTAIGAIEFCSGSSVTLSVDAQTGSSYQWKKDTTTTGSNSTSLVVTDAGAYTIELTNGCGTVAAVNTIDVVVNTLPAIPVFTAKSATDICPDASVTLAVQAGINETIAWYKNTSILTGKTDSLLTVNTAGDYKVKLTNATGCTTESAVKSVTVLTTPTASITSPATAFCPGATSVILTANTDANATYQWIKDAVLSTVFTSTFDATLDGAYKAILSYSNGCSDTSNTITLTAAPQPVATLSSSATEICSGSSATLTAGVVSNASYNWYNGGVKATGPTTTNTYSTNQSGTFTVEVISDKGCKDTSDAQVITVKALPSTSLSYTATSFCTGGSVTLTAEVIGGATYEWFRNNVSQGAASSNNIFTVTQAGSYKYTVNNSCTATSKAVVISENTLPNAAGSISGSNSFCAGTVVDYSIYAVPGATNYKWEIIPASAGSITNGQGTDAITISWKNTAAQVKVTPNNFCGNGTASTLSVTIDNSGYCTMGNILFSGSPTNICVGNTVTFTNYTDESSMFGTTANWDFGAGASPATATGKGPHTVTYSTAGLKTIVLEYKDQYGFSAGNETKTDYINVSDGNVTTSAINGNATLTNCSGTESYNVTNTAGSTYNWTVPAGATIQNGQSSNQISVIFNGTMGDIKVIETTAAGCIGSAKSLTVDCSVGIAQTEENSNSYKLYPNPTSALITIESTNINTSSELKLISITGQVVLESLYSVSYEGNRTTLNLSNLADGVYILNINTEKENVNYRVIKN